MKEETAQKSLNGERTTASGTKPRSTSRLQLLIWRRRRVVSFFFFINQWRDKEVIFKANTVSYHSTFKTPNTLPHVISFTFLVLKVQ